MSEKAITIGHLYLCFLFMLILTGFISLAQSIYVSGTTAIEAYRQNNRVSTSKNRTIRRVNRNNLKQYHLSRSQRDQTVRRG